MSLSGNDIKKIGHLSRIHIDESEYDAVATQLNSIFGWIDKLQNVNTDNVIPYKYCDETPLLERDDVIVEGDMVSLILQNAPEKAHFMFAVPKVVE